MKKFLFLFAVVTSITCFAASLPKEILKITAIVSYDMDNDGYYICHKDSVVKNTYPIIKYYAYDKKNHKLYAFATNANYVYDCDDSFHKKTRKDIPFLKNEDINILIENHNKELKEKFDNYNQQRTIHIRDSIQKVEELAKKREEETLKRQQEYVKTHNKHYMKKNQPLKCLICDEYNFDDSLYVMFFKQDTIYYMEVK